MNDVFTILKELTHSWKVVFRIAKYNNEQVYQSNYLGDFWHFADPALQIGVMLLMFASRASDTYSNPNAHGIQGYVAWIALGMLTYFYIQSSMLSSAKSIQYQINLLSRMNFSLSAIPLTSIITELRRYFVMMSMFFCLLLFTNVRPTLWWFQFFYYFIAMIIFVYALALVTSTVTVLIPDFYNAYAAVLRVGMWLSGVIIPIDGPQFPYILSNILKVNPIYYLIQGFRSTLLENPVGFWVDSGSLLTFWSIVLLLFIGGAHLHMRFRNRFMDFV